PRFADLRWIALGAAVLLALLAGAVRLQSARQPELLLQREARIDLVERMRATLATESAAGMDALTAPSAPESQVFADRSRESAGRIESLQRELETRLGADGPAKEALARFTKTFAELQSVDRELLALVVRHTNTQARALAYGPAAEARVELSAALARLVDRNPEIARLALAAEAAALRTEV